MDFSTFGTVSSYINSVQTTSSMHKSISDMCSSKSAYDGRRYGSASADCKDFSAEALRAARNAAAAEKQISDSAPTDVKSAEGKNTGKTAEKSETEEKSISQIIKEQTEKIDSLFEKKYDKSRDSKLSSIKAKMRCGIALNSGEQAYLAAKDPDTYSTFKKTESARKMFRCSLNSCRTRDEVNAMRLSNALSALSAYKKSIKKGGDGSEVAGLNASLDKEMRSFMGSSSYKRLPTTAECNKFDSDLAKARKYEREKKLEEQRKLAKNSKKNQKQKKTPGDGKRTVAQVLADPVSKKVLASRAKRTYCTCGASVDFMSKMSSKA